MECKRPIYQRIPTGLQLRGCHLWGLKRHSLVLILTAANNDCHLLSAIYFNKCIDCSLKMLSTRTKHFRGTSEALPVPVTVL